MRIRVYQINPTRDERKVKFRGFEETNQRGGVDFSTYKKTFDGYVEAKMLDEVYNAFNGHSRVPTHQGHSLSVSDIVEVLGDVPEIYGKIGFLCANENDHVGKIGETLYYTDKESFEAEIKASNDCGRPINATVLENEHFKLTEEGIYFCDDVGWEKINVDTGEGEDMEGVRVLMINPGKPPVETRVIDELEHWQNAVSDHGEEAYMEVTYPFEDSAVIVGNEEAKLIGMKGNRHVLGSVYAGPIYIANDDGQGGFCDLTDEQIEKYSKMFETPEDISDDETQGDCGFIITGW